MKTMRMNLKSLALIAVLSTGMFAVSCDKENDLFMQDNMSAQNDLKKGQSVPPGTQSIAAIALADDGEFDELVAALIHVDTELNAGLVNLFLNGTDQYTVFAPTDAAFEALYQTLGVSAITEVDAQTVLNVLLYHVTEGRRAANSVVPKNGTRTIETLLGSTFSVSTSGQITAVGNKANIVKANISASNGIIHVIDTVILPITL